MSDIYRLRLTNAAGDDPQEGVEVLSLDLYPGGPEDIYRQATLMFLAKEGIYARRVEDKRTLVSVGASAEVHDVLIFLAGAGSAAFTGEIAKRLASMLHDLARRLMGHDPEIGDSQALSLATLRHLEMREYAQLQEMSRNDLGNRQFRFSDGVIIELDRHGNAVNVSTVEPLVVSHHLQAAEDD